MDPIKAALRTRLLSITEVAAKVGTRIYPKHISLVTNPQFPCITIHCDNDADDDYNIADNMMYYIDVWSKEGNDELWEIFGPIKTDFKNTPFIQGVIYFLKRMSVKDDLYESDTKTYHLASRYKIIAK